MRYRFLIKTNPATAEQEDEYNTWYNDVHLKQVLQLPGFVAAERFVYGPRQVAGTPEPTHKYLATYDVDTDDLEASLAALRERMASGEIILSPAADIANSWGEIFVALSDGPSYAKLEPSCGDP